MRNTIATALLAVLILSTPSCNYVRLLRPSVLRQLTPETAELLNYLPRLEDPNKAILGRLFAQGGLVHAQVAADGVMHARIRVRAGKMMWQPSIVVLPHAGTLDLLVYNEDAGTQVVSFPSNGDQQILVLPAQRAGRVRITLDDPGLYTFANSVANTAGQGMIGALIVEGQVPPDARLARTAQKRPGQ